MCAELCNSAELPLSQTVLVTGVRKLWFMIVTMEKWCSEKKFLMFFFSLKSVYKPETSFTFDAIFSS